MSAHAVASCSRCSRDATPGRKTCEVCRESLRAKSERHRRQKGAKPRAFYSREEMLERKRLQEMARRRARGERPWEEYVAAIKGITTSQLAERQKPCSECGEVFDTGARMGTKRYSEKRLCGKPSCRAESDRRKMAKVRNARGLLNHVSPLARPSVAARLDSYRAEAEATIEVVGHENGVPVKRAPRGVGYNDL